MSLHNHQTPSTKSAAAFTYFIKVVPTLYQYISGFTVDSNQFSATDFVVELNPEHPNIQPGVWFKYDFSPIMVKKMETRHSIWEFFISCCAILGGVYAISGIFNELVYRGFSKKKD
jgi:hypothetical protein